MRKSVIAVAALCVAASAAAEDASRPAKLKGKRKIDEKADNLLRKMSKDLADTKSFRFDARHVTEVVTKDGQKLEMLADSNLTIQRPNKLRSERTGAIADVTLYYDGDNITIAGNRRNLYATAQAPKNLDEAIDFARDELGLEAPGADLLTSDVYSGLMEDVVAGMYVGLEPVGDRMCHHLAYRANETDWQIWIDDGARALPCRYTITSKKVKGSPEYSVDLTNWDVNPKIDDAKFTFTPPPDAMKIDFLAAAEKRKEISQRPTKATKKDNTP